MEKMEIANLYEEGLAQWRMLLTGSFHNEVHVGSWSEDEGLFQAEFKYFS